jgi:hypothetical protein
MDNGPARKNKIAEKLQTAGEEVGDPFEISTVRGEVGFIFYLFLMNSTIFI